MHRLTQVVLVWTPGRSRDRGHGLGKRQELRGELVATPPAQLELTARIEPLVHQPEMRWELL